MKKLSSFFQTLFVFVVFKSTQTKEIAYIEKRTIDANGNYRLHCKTTAGTLSFTTTKEWYFSEKKYISITYATNRFTGKKYPLEREQLSPAAHKAAVFLTNFKNSVIY